MSGLGGKRGILQNSQEPSAWEAGVPVSMGQQLRLLLLFCIVFFLSLFWWVFLLLLLFLIFELERAKEEIVKQSARGMTI